MIRVDELQKSYGGFAAVVGSSFSVDAGEIFGIVGPNGAGKTTTLKMISGLIEPSGGTATVAGFDASDPQMRQSLGFLPEESPLYEDMTPRSYLRFFADLYDVPREEAIERTEATLDRLELEYRDRRLGDMSKGMKRKVAIARSLVNDPDVLIYDEPASGLDPLTTNTVLAFTRELKAAGKTVIFSAHNLYHVESICDRLIIMNEGQIIANGSISDLRDEYGTREYQIWATHCPTDLDPAETIDSGDSSSYLYIADTLEDADLLREKITRAGGDILDFRTEESTLESIFLELTGKPMAGSRTIGGSK
ncbi:ABC transporter ATP-binding protein [Halorubraceae archaeon YAN]|nr:ABC transporter ATP-binding protein [Halorubraceae archaeon YAN]